LKGVAGLVSKGGEAGERDPSESVDQTMLTRDVDRALGLKGKKEKSGKAASLHTEASSSPSGATGKERKRVLIS